jgi:hypothetical protein
VISGVLTAAGGSYLAPETATIAVGSAGGRLGDDLVPRDRRGTLTLAMTTYLSVRSANQAARTAERTLLAELRPLVIQSSLDDADQRIGFMDNVGLTVPGGTTGVEIIERRIYLVFSLRNVGPGIAVLHGASTATTRAASA